MVKKIVQYIKFLFCLQLMALPISYAEFDFLSDVSESYAPASHKANYNLLESAPKTAPAIYKKSFITENDVREEIKKQLQEKYALEGELKIFLNKAFQEIAIPSESWALEIIQCPPDKISDKFLITFSLACQGKSLGQWQLPVRAELWQNAYISLKYIRKGEDLLDRNFKINPIDVLRMRGRSVSTNEDLRNYIAFQNVPQNDVLIYHDLKRKPDVLKGQIVNLVATEAGMKINMKAKALEDGIKGEYITVQNMQSKKTIQAEIIGDKLLKVHF